TAEARVLAEQAITESRGRDWYRYWSGAPALKAFEYLEAIDAAAARELAFVRFAEIAAGDRFFLGEFATALADQLPLFSPYDHQAVAEEVVRHLAGVVREDRIDEVLGSGTNSTSSMAEGFGKLVSWCIGSGFTLGWTSGQRALLRGLVETADAGESWVREAGQHPWTRGRVLAVLDAAPDDWPAPPGVVSLLEEWSGDGRLDLRKAASALCERFGGTPQAPESRPLPRALELELPVAARDPDDEHLIGREGEELMRDLHDQEIERLAEVAEIDPGALRGRLAQIARKAETPEVDPK